MVVNYGSQSLNRDEQLSDKSEAGSTLSENPARIEDIFEWIDGIPLSKTTKNLARDFSDAVLMSEILKFYYPQLVSSHNYIPANSTANKKENWNTLNRKVLAKIDMHLSPETIEQLAHSQQGVINKVLNDFRDKQMAISIKEVGGVDPDEQPSISSEILDASAAPKPKKYVQRVEQPQRVDEPAPRRSIFGSIYYGIKGFFAAIFRFLLAIICFWRWFSRNPSKPSRPVEQQQQVMAKHEELLSSEDEEQLREAYRQVLEELRVKADVIKTLCHKIAFLEGTMKLKDLKISSLSNQLDSAGQTSELVTSARSNAPPSNLPKMRRRPRTQV